MIGLFRLRKQSNQLKVLKRQGRNIGDGWSRRGYHQYCRGYFLEIVAEVNAAFHDDYLLAFDILQAFGET